MNLSYVTNQSNNRAIMNLYKPIGMGGVNGSDFADQILYLEDMGYTNIDVRINSPGGNVLDGFSIFSAIRNCNMRGNCMVNTYVDYLAASIAGVISLAGKERYIVSNGRFMMHNVFGPDITDKEKEILSDLKKTIVDVFSSFPGNSSEMISKLMDEETWLPAKKAIKMGFFHDEFPVIVPDAQLKNKSAIELYEFSNSILTNKNNKDQSMKDEQELIELKAKALDYENKLSTALADNKALKDKAAEKETELEAENATLTEEITALKEKLAEKESILAKKAEEEKAKLEKDATDFVKNLTKAGVIEKKFEQANIDLAIKDFEGYKNAMNGIKQAPARFTNVAGSAEGKKDKEDRDDWTYRDWEKKDPAGLENMLANDPERAQELYNNTYKK